MTSRHNSSDFFEIGLRHISKSYPGKTITYFKGSSGICCERVFTAETQELAEVLGKMISSQSQWADSSELAAENLLPLPKSVIPACFLAGIQGMFGLDPR
jgi:hypothetical protein